MKGKFRILLWIGIFMTYYLVACGSKTGETGPVKVKLSEGYIAMDNEYAYITLSMPKDSIVVGLEQEFSIENRTDQTIIVNMTKSIINDYDISTIFYEEIEPGQTKKGNIYWTTTGVHNIASASEVTSVGVGFEITNKSKKVLYSGPLVIADKNYDDSSNNKKP